MSSRERRLKFDELVRCGLLTEAEAADTQRAEHTAQSVQVLLEALHGYPLKLLAELEECSLTAVRRKIDVGCDVVFGEQRPAMTLPWMRCPIHRDRYTRLAYNCWFALIGEPHRIRPVVV